MRNIANGAIDGLPTELRTVFVQHDIVASDVSVCLCSCVVFAVTCCMVSSFAAVRAPSVFFLFISPAVVSIRVCTRVLLDLGVDGASRDT